MQVAPTKKINEKIIMLLDYLNTYKNTKIWIYASDMQLHVDCDTAYLVIPRAESRIAGHFYCNNTSTTSPPTPPLNSPLHVACKLLRHIVKSAVEAERVWSFP